MIKSTKSLLKKQKKKVTKNRLPSSPFQTINVHAAGIDIGSQPHFVAVSTSTGD